MPVSPNQKAPVATKTSTPAYTPPPAGAGATSTAGTKYGFDITDPYGLGTLATTRINEGNEAPYGNIHDATAGTSGGPATNDQVGPGWASADQILNSFMSSYGSNTSLFQGLRQDLTYGGYYGSTALKDVQGRAAGQWDADAMKQAMADWLKYAHYTQSPMSFGSWLAGQKGSPNSLGAGGGNGGSGGSTRAPLQLTSSATLDQYGNQAGQTELGRNLTTGEQAGFVGKFHGEEQSAYNGGAENAGDPTAEAKNFVDTSSQQEVQTHLQAGYAAKIMSILGIGNG